MSDVQERIQSLVKDNQILLFMKGDREFPQCGFSMRAVNVVNSFGREYKTINVLEDPEIRQGIKSFSNWPTIPQLYLNGQFVGGSDIMIELYHSGELQKLVDGLA
jgi:monothiol glutaredoxin